MQRHLCTALLGASRFNPEPQKFQELSEGSERSICLENSNDIPFLMVCFHFCCIPIAVYGTSALPPRWEFLLFHWYVNERLKTDVVFFFPTDLQMYML